MVRMWVEAAAADVPDVGEEVEEPGPRLWRLATLMSPDQHLKILPHLPTYCES